MKDEYKIKENGFDEIRKKALLKLIPILACVITAMLVMHFFSNLAISKPYVLWISLPIIAGAIMFGTHSGFKRQKKIFESYALLIEEDKITRLQNQTPDIIIPTSEIKAISKHKNGAISIKGNKASDLIGVPIQIERKDELELRLATILEITPLDKISILQRFQFLIPLLTVVLMLTVYISKNKILVGLSATVLTTLLIVSLVYIQKSKHIDHRTKRSMWIVLLVLISIISIAYMKLSGKV